MVQFRQATNDDAKTLKDIAKRVIKTNYVSFLGVEATTDFIESGMSDKEIDDGLENCNVMLYNEQIIGFVITNESVLHLIMLDTPFQNAGYGSALLAHTTSKLFSKFENIYLQTFEENTRAVQFYLKHDWAISCKEVISDLGKTMVHFEKSRSNQLLNGL